MMTNAKRQKWYVIVGVLLAVAGFGWIAMDHWQIVLWKRTIPLTDKKTTHCPIHGDELLIEKVPVAGFRTVSYEPGYQQAVWEAQSRLFPWAGEWCGAGAYGSKDPKVGWRMRKRCPSCSEVAKRWHEDYRETESPNK